MNRTISFAMMLPIALIVSAASAQFSKTGTKLEKGSLGIGSSQLFESTRSIPYVIPSAKVLAVAVAEDEQSVQVTVSINSTGKTMTLEVCRDKVTEPLNMQKTLIEASNTAGRGPDLQIRYIDEGRELNCIDSIGVIAK